MIAPKARNAPTTKLTRPEMIKVATYPEADPVRVAQIYAGLADLHTQGLIHLTILKRCPRIIRHPAQRDPNILWLELQSPDYDRHLSLCFDVRDQGDIIAVTRLRDCDIYVKRSYSQSYVDSLEPVLARKIIPYGLHYSCSSKNVKARVLRWLVFYYHQKRFLSLTSALMKHTILEALKLRRYPPLSEDFEVRPEEPSDQKVLFQTRVWDPRRYKKREKINKIRADTVRALKSAFGKRFVGGLVPTPFAKERYADCLSTHSYRHDHFINLIRTCLVAVTSTGLHDSIGWKIPEYLAASRCIVTEPLKFELPISLEEKKHFLSYRTPQECVQACQVILNQPELAQEMRRSNWEYYENNVRPSVLLHKVLTKAIERYKNNG